MEWDNKDQESLEQINVLRLNPNQIGFYKTMKKFASIGVKPSIKQLKYLHQLSKIK
jgi:hypothetical protein